MQIYVNRIKNRIVFRLKTDNKLELQLEETMKQLRSTQTNRKKNKNSEHVQKVKMVEVVVCIVMWLITVISKHQRCYLPLYPTKCLVH